MLLNTSTPVLEVSQSQSRRQRSSHDSVEHTGNYAPPNLHSLPEFCSWWRVKMRHHGLRSRGNSHFTPNTPWVSDQKLVCPSVIEPFFKFSVRHNKVNVSIIFMKLTGFIFFLFYGTLWNTNNININSLLLMRKLSLLVSSLRVRLWTLAECPTLLSSPIYPIYP